MIKENKTVLDSSQVEAALRSLDGWRREGDSLVREWKFERFSKLMPFLRGILDTMDRINHHCDLAVDSRSKTVRIAVTTHSTRSITQADVDFAGALNDL